MEHFSGKYFDSLVFLLHKAAEVTRTFNKKKTGSKRRERVELLNELNSVISDKSSTIQDIETVEDKLVKFDEEDIHPLLLRSENYRLLEDERPTKRFLNLENDKAKYNNVSRLQIIDKTTDPPTEIKTTRLTTKPEEILGEFQSKFATIYSKQTGVDGSEESIINFLNSSYSPTAEKSYNT